MAAAILAAAPGVPAEPAGLDTERMAPVAPESAPTVTPLAGDVNRSNHGLSGFELPSDSDDVQALGQAIINSGFLRESALGFFVVDHPPESNGTTGSDRVARVIEATEIMQSERAGIFGMTPLVVDTLALGFSLVGVFAAVKLWRNRRAKTTHVPEARFAYVRRRTRRRRRHKGSPRHSVTQAAR